MSTLRPSEHPLDGSGRRIGVVASRFNEAIVDRLLEGALTALARHGVAPGAVKVVRVPGAWEIPVALESLARHGRFDGLLALGAVIRGGTPHFEYVAGECARGAMEVSLRHALPVGFGVLTCDDQAQAEARAGGALGNKGDEAALAVLEMAGALERLGD
jgi:6,7-dimethyl-8-ribityllumazine synthase